MTEPVNQQSIDSSASRTDASLLTDLDHKTTQRYLDIARTTLSQTSMVATLWLAAVIIAWWSIEQEIGLRSAELRAYTTQYIDAYKAYEEQQKDCRDQSKKEDDNTHNTSNRIYKKIDVCERTSAHRERTSEAKLAYNQAKNSTIEFNLPTFSKFRAPTQLAPLVLTVIILSLASYMAFMRERVFRYLSKALRNFKEAQKLPLQKIGDVLAPRPWWIGPLPNKSGEFVSSEEFASSLGWSNHKEVSFVFIGTFWFILLLIQFLLIIDGASFNHEIRRIEQLEPLESMSTVLVSGLYWCLFGMTVSLAVHWFLPASIPDACLQPRDEINHSRRMFLIHISTGIALALVVRGSVENVFLKAVHQVRRPRYRKKQFHTTTRAPKNGLLINPKSGVVHAVHGGNVIGLDHPKHYSDKPKLEHWHLFEELAALSFTTSLPKRNSAAGAPFGILPHANQSHTSIVSELVFHQALNKQEYKTALAVMTRGIEQDIIFKRKARIVREIDTGVGALKNSRRKPRKRHKGVSQMPSASANQEQDKIEWIPRVSFRLYDLIAKSSVQLGQPDWMNKMLLIIEQHKLQTLFKDRIAKWKDTNSQWHRGITNQGRSSNVG